MQAMLILSVEFSLTCDANFGKNDASQFYLTGIEISAAFIGYSELHIFPSNNRINITTNTTPIIPDGP
jgi:hypothetical protein